MSAQWPRLATELAGAGNSAVFEWRGGRGTVALGGTFGGTATLQYSPDGGTTWFSVLDVAGNAIAVTAAANRTFELGAVGLRLNAGAGVTAVDAWLDKAAAA